MKFNHKHTIFLLLVLAIVSSCGLKQPEDKPQIEIHVGSIYVASSIPGARIFVDSDTTGKVTPDTIKNLSLGLHVVRVFKDGYFINPDSLTVTVEKDSVSTAQFELEFITNQGKLFFESIPAGAEIFVNNNSSGKFTPDTVIVAADTSYNFALYKHGFENIELGNFYISTNTLTSFNETLIVEKQVLIESFANSSCLPCTTTNVHIENFVSNVDEKNYSLIEYFTNWPNNHDPMYLHNRTDIDARIFYYYVLSVPAMYVAGNTVDAQNYNSIFSAYNSQYNSASQDVSITLSSQITDSLRVNVEVNEFTPLTGSDWRLFIAAIEKEVHFATPPGANNLDTFSHVFRKFLTDNTGDVMTFTNNKFEKKYSSSISSVWDLSEIQIISFIQNISTKEVIQSSHL